jgi:hypothetical protein
MVYISDDCGNFAGLRIAICYSSTEGPTREQPMPTVKPVMSKCIRASPKRREDNPADERLELKWNLFQRAGEYHQVKNIAATAAAIAAVDTNPPPIAAAAG